MVFTKFSGVTDTVNVETGAAIVPPLAVTVTPVNLVPSTVLVK